MQQYFAKDEKLTLHSSDYHHIKNVMRMKKGDLIKIAFDKKVYLCKIKSLDEFSFDVISEETYNQNEIDITVAFSLIKEQKLDYLLQKATEVGVSGFIPIETIRSVVKIDKSKKENKIIRWQKICKEASEQSFRNEVPIINDILKIDDLIKMEDFDLKLLCSLNENSKNIKKVLQKNNKCDRILLVVGPEGGFDPKEEEVLMKNNFISVSLGNTVLRAETAPVVAAGMIKYEFMR